MVSMNEIELWAKLSHPEISWNGFLFALGQLDMTFLSSVVFVGLALTCFLASRSHCANQLRHLRACSEAEKTGSLCEAETTRLRVDASNLLYRFVTGPVLFMVLLGFIGLIFEARYRAATADFERSLAKVKICGQSDKYETQIRELKQKDYHWRERNLRDDLHISLLRILSRSRADNFLVRDRVLLFQLIDGYRSDGSPIWSSEIQGWMLLEPSQSRVNLCQVRKTMALDECNPAQPYDLNSLAAALSEYSSGEKQCPAELELTGLNAERFGLKGDAVNGYSLEIIWESFPDRTTGAPYSNSIFSLCFPPVPTVK